MNSVFWRNRHLLWLCVLILLIGGLSALGSLPRQEDPRLTNRFPMVITPWPGASAERVEALITRPLEEAIRTVAEVQTIEADSRPGISSISIELGDAVTDVDRVNSRLRDKVADVPLPDGVSADFDDERGAVAYSLVIALTWHGTETAPLDLLARLGNDLAERLRHLPGTERVDTAGIPEEEIRVTLDDAKLADRGLTLAHVTALLTAADSKTTAGVMTTPGYRLPLEVSGAYAATNAIAAVPLRVTNGQVTRIADIATVERTWRMPETTIAIHNGQRAILIGARLERGYQLDDWAVPAQRVIDTFDHEQGALIRIDNVFDQRHYTDARIYGLADNLIMGAMVIMVVIILLMGPRAALVVGLALPLTFGGLLMVLAAAGIPLHQMSLFGTIIALGLLIDNAIVMVDETRKRLRDGLTPGAAVVAAVNHLRTPLISSTLTTVFSFMPIALMPGPAGEFVGSIAIAVIAALITSLLVALCLLPTLTALIGRPQTKDASNSWRDGAQWPWLHRISQQLLSSALRYPGATVLIVLAIAGMGMMRARELGQQFFPAADRDMFQIRVWLPPGSSIERTRGVVDEIDSILATEQDILAHTWHLGGSMLSVYYNQIMDTDQDPGYAQAAITATNLTTAARLVSDLQARLDQAIPRAQVVVSPFAQGPPVPAPVMFRLVGPDGDRLRQMGEELRAILAAVPGVTHTQARMQGGAPKLWLDADAEEIREQGWTRSELAKRLRLRLDGGIGGSQLEATEDLPVRVVSRQLARPDNLLDLPLASGDHIMPLGAIASLRLEPELASVLRRNGQRTNIISAYVVPEALPPEITAAATQAFTAADWQTPDGYHLEIGGDSEESAQATGNLATFAPVLGLLMLTSLILAFRSVTLAAIIGLVAIGAVGFGLLALRIAGYPFGFNPILGVAGLIGLAINDSIVVLAAIRDDARARAGAPDAIARAALGCGRHVLATTATTIGGFLPLLLSGGAFWPPLAVIIAGGVLGATLLALVLVPAAYALVLTWGRLGRALAAPA